jgi:hypothetical protein
MNTRTSPAWPALLGAFALLLSACAETPEDRIRENQATFSSYSPEQRELIKQGQVGIGFDEAAVKLAVGEPDRISERTDDQGQSRVWRYVEYETDQGTMLYTGFYHHYYAPAFPYYLDYPSRRERDVMTVTFRNGKVVSVEREVK